MKGKERGREEEKLDSNERRAFNTCRISTLNFNNIYLGHSKEEIKYD